MKTNKRVVTVRGGKGEFARTTQYAVKVTNSTSAGAMASEEVSNASPLLAFGDTVEEAVDALQELLNK